VFKVSRSEEQTRDDHLQPVHTPSTWLIRRCRGGEHFHHKSLAAVFHTLLEKSLNLIGRTPIGRLCKVKFRLDELKVLPQKLASLFQLLRQKTLSYVSFTHKSIENEPRRSGKVGQRRRDERER